MRRPGEMLGDQRRLVALDQSPEARQMRLVERPRAADRHADAVQRERVVAPDRSQARDAAARRRPYSSRRELRRSPRCLPSCEIAPRCSCLKLVPARPPIGIRRKAKTELRCRRRRCGSLRSCRRLRFPLVVRRAQVSDRLERAVLAVRHLDAGAGAALDELP